MNFRTNLILASLLGMSATFMPWVTYPKSNMSLYGYVGDGIVTAFLFFLILVFALRFNKIQKGKLWLTFISGLLGCLIVFLAIDKVTDLNDQMQNYSPDSQVLALAAAGVYADFGLYVLGVAGFFTALFSTILLLTNKLEFDNKSWLNKMLGPALLIILIGLFTFIGVNKYSSGFSSQVNPDDFETQISSNLNQMGEALINKDYSKFIAFNHDIMIQSLGGKDKMVEIIKSTMDRLKTEDTEIVDVSFDRIDDIAQQGNSIQSIFYQQVTYDVNGEEKKEIQKMLAVSEDGSSNWKFINLSNGKSKQEIKKIFPSLNPNLKFD